MSLVLLGLSCTANKNVKKQMSENEEFIYQSIYNQIRMGFHSIDEIKANVIEEIEDNEFEKEISSEWVNRTIKREFDILKVESETWKHPTDTERLITAFEELSKFKIIALHNAGYTTRDGEDEVLEIERKLKELDKKSDGYCFYHEQDLERALAPNNPNLLIAFQKVNNSNDEITIAIGKKIVEVLKNNNFKVNWNETVDNKIELTGFSWKKIYNSLDENILDHQRVLKLM